MIANRRQSGFSLIETLLAIGTLAIGMVFVAGTFMTGVYLTTASTERTIATVVADEAVAKISLLGMDPNDSKLKADRFVPCETVRGMDVREFTYPSFDPNERTARGLRGDYAWSAICRRDANDSRLVDCTIFISRLMGSGARYWVCDSGYGPVAPSSSTSSDSSVPRPVRIQVTLVKTAGTTSTLTAANAAQSRFMDSGSILVGDDTMGQVYRVLDRSGVNSDQITVNPAWRGGATGWVWVVPRPVSGGRCPAVAVYQKVIRF
jgi:Tfp pilus assembly protein PilV